MKPRSPFNAMPQAQSTARREADRLARCTDSWWIDPQTFYVRAHQEAIRMNQQTTNYDQRKEGV